MAKQKRSNKRTTGRSSSNFNNYGWVKWTAMVLPIVIASVVHQYWLDAAMESESSSPLSGDTYSGSSAACQFVMAESSYENGGWGIFTLDNLPMDTPLPFDSPIILLINLQQSNLVKAGMDHFLDSYAWTGGAILGQFEAHASHGMATGIGMLANGNGDPSLINTAPRRGDNFRRLHGSNGSRRYVSPVAGSSTSYQDFGYATTRSVPAGSEIIISYGPGWDQKMAMFAAVGQQKNKQTAANSLARPVKWLQEHGYCLDNIKPIDVGERGHGIALRGAHTQPGSVIVSIPLLPLHRSSLEMAQADGKIRNKKYQLALNYMLGHEDSDLLLMPYGPVFSLINHYNSSGTSSSGRKPHEKPNAKLEWDTESLQTWLKTSVDDVLMRNVKTSSSSKGSSLLAHLVALDPIAPGEEIVIDYGAPWQRAWDAHLAAFSKHRSQDTAPPPHHVYANEFNNDPANKVLRDRLSQATHPYPAHLKSICVLNPTWPIQKTEMQQEYKVTQVMWDDNRLDVQVFLPCVILERHDSSNGENTYVVQIGDASQNNGDAAAQSQSILEPKEFRIVTNMPRAGLLFVDRPYQSDQHLDGAFRHEIEALPFPPQWLN